MSTVCPSAQSPTSLKPTSDGAGDRDGVAASELLGTGAAQGGAPATTKSVPAAIHTRNVTVIMRLGWQDSQRGLAVPGRFLIRLLAGWRGKPPRPAVWRSAADFRSACERLCVGSELVRLFHAAGSWGSAGFQPSVRSWITWDSNGRHWASRLSLAHSSAPRFDATSAVWRVEDPAVRGHDVSLRPRAVERRPRPQVRQYVRLRRARLVAQCLHLPHRRSLHCALGGRRLTPSNAAWRPA